MVSGARPASIRGRSFVKALRATTRSQPASRAATARSFWTWERKPTAGTPRVPSSDPPPPSGASGRRGAGRVVLGVGEEADRGYIACYIVGPHAPEERQRLEAGRVQVEDEQVGW